MHIDQAVDHLALALAHRRHVDPDILLADAEFLAAKKVGRDLGAVDDVLARQAGDVRARAADVFALDDRGTRPFWPRSRRCICRASPLPRTTRSYSSGGASMGSRLYRAAEGAGVSAVGFPAPSTSGNTAQEGVAFFTTICRSTCFFSPSSS